MFDNIHDGTVYKYLYAGEWIYSINKHTILVKSSCDNKVLGSIQCVTKEEIDKCIISSKDSLKLISDMSTDKIKSALSSAGNSILELSKHLSGLISLETSKTILSSEKEVVRTYNLLSYIVNNYERLHKTKGISFFNSSPVGTVLITPSSDFPIYSTACRFIAAILSGNSVLLNPSLRGTISVLHVSEIFNKHFNIRGIINTVTGVLPPLNDYLISHKGINFIHFTGQDTLGRHIAICSKNIPLNIQTNENYISHIQESLKEDIDTIIEYSLSMRKKIMK